jgi:hypothetical protein
MPAKLQSKYKLLKSSSYSILKAYRERERERAGDFLGVYAPNNFAT